MFDIKKNVAALLKVKTIVTFGVLAVFVAMALSGKIASNDVMAIVMMVFAFYFGTQTDKK